MEMDWVRDICEQCDAAGVAFFLKQYYGGATGNRLIKDGLLDGIVRQDFPTHSSEIA